MPKTKRPPADPRPPLLVGLWGGNRTAAVPYPPGTPADPASITPAQHAAAVAGLLLAAMAPGDILPDDLMAYLQLPQPAGHWAAPRPGNDLYELLECIAGRRPFVWPVEITPERARRVNR